MDAEPRSHPASPASRTTTNIRSHESKKMSDMITNHADIDVFIGIDVGKHNHHAVALDRDGKQLDRGRPLHSLSSSNRGPRLVEGPGLDHREQNVEPATSQTHHRSIMAFPLSTLPVVIRLRQGIMT